MYVSCYDIPMPRTTKLLAGDRALLCALADFRYRLRAFVHSSEQASQEAGLQPRQHQLLLQVAGAPEDRHATAGAARIATTIAYAAERLGLKHNSTVELVNRSVAEGLLRRTEDPQDRRRVVLHITPRGKAVLHRLSTYHARELYDLAPALLRSIRGVARAESSRQRSAGAGKRRSA